MSGVKRGVSCGGVSRGIRAALGLLSRDEAGVKRFQFFVHPDDLSKVSKLILDLEIARRIPGRKMSSS